MQQPKIEQNINKQPAQITIDKTSKKSVSNIKVVSPEDVIPLENDTEGF